MTKSFLISFCNNKILFDKSKSIYLGRLNIDTRRQTSTFERIILELPEGLSGNGITGMCKYNNGFILLLQRNPSTLLFVNNQFEFEKYWDLDGLRGVHSILVNNHSIYLSVTNQDKIVVVNKDKEKKQIWSKNTNTDTVHLNSICIHQNQLYATAFGPKAENLWSSARSGKAFNTETNEAIITDIWHPHSLISYNDQLYCCDSSNQRIVGEDGVFLSNLPGYTRGLYIDDDIAICGSSLGRLVSHSTGQKISNKSDKGKLAGVCGISYMLRSNQTTTFVNLEDTAFEVFDILPI